MKRLSMMLTLLLAMVGSVVAQDYFSVSPVTIKAGETKDVAINLTNATEFSAFQFDLLLPKDVVIGTEDGELSVWLNNERIEINSKTGARSHSIQANKIDSNEGNLYTVVSYSDASKPFKGNSGEIAYITLEALSTATSGIQSATLKNIVLTDSDGKKTVSDDVTFNITIDGTTPATDPKAYAVWCEGNTTLYFTYTKDVLTAGGAFDGQTITAVWSGEDVTASPQGHFAAEPEVETAWQATVKDKVTKVVFQEAFKDVRMTSTAGWFNGCEKLKAIDGMQYLNTENVTSMREMFLGCLSLESVNLNYLNTANVTNMWGMFQYTGLKSLNLSSFNTSKVTSMIWMFGNSKSLESINLSSFDTQNVIEMNFMFVGCIALKSIDVSHLNTSNVVRMTEMFGSCKSLTELDVTKLNTSKVYNFGYMFSGCSGLTSLDVSHFDTSSATNMHSMFSSLNNIKELDLTNFNTSKVTNMEGMFNYNPELKTIYVGENWSTANVTSSNNMFKDCPKIVGGNGTAYDANHTDATYARIDGGSTAPGYLTDKAAASTPVAYAALSEGNTVLTFYYDTKKAERGGMNIAFLASQSPWRDYADKITTVTITREMAQYTGVTSTAYWFYGMENLTTINGLPYLYTANVMYMNNMFGGCKNLASVDLSNFNTSSATMIDGMFADCGLISVDLSTFNTSNVTSVAKMFAGCSQLRTITFGPEFSLPEVKGTGLYVFQTPALKEIVINRDVPVVPSDFFNEVGSEHSPVKLTVPDAYLANYKARMTDGKLFGGYFRFGDEEVVDLTAQKDELLAAIKQQESTLIDLETQIRTQQNSLSNTLTQMSTRQEALSRAFTKAQNDLANAEISDADRSTLNSMLSGIQSAVQYATQLLANLTQGLQTDLPRLTERLQSADEYIYKVKAGVQSATTQADIDQAKTMMKQSMADVSDLESAFKNLATQTANSQTELDNSQNSIEDKLNEFNQKLSNAISNSGVEIQLDGATFAVNSNLYTVELTKASTTSDYYEIPLYVTYNGMEYLVTAIGSSAFENSNVEVVIIPAGVEMIGPRAFANCYRLREIYSYSKVPSYYANLARQKASTGIISVFENVDVAYCTLYVPAGCVMRYRTSPLWSQFSMITELNRATDVKPTWVGDGEKTDIYDLKGRKVREGARSMEGLPKGVYVVNGKKMVVR